MDQSSLFAYVVWIFLAFLTYPVVPPYLLSHRMKIPFVPGISMYSFFYAGCISSEFGTFMKFNVIQTLEWKSNEDFTFHCFPLDQCFRGGRVRACDSVKQKHKALRGRHPMPYHKSIFFLYDFPDVRLYCLQYPLSFNPSASFWESRTDNQEKDEKQSQNDKTGLGMEKTVKDKAKSKPESQSSQKVNRKVNWSKSKSTQVNPGAKVQEI
ncbi:hypothetical protein Tco_0820166 [Tanacetum coccineum]|uniref:Uncharacterized protein n=1 Tax=Tanacetum coccineum TaxID=301880 RepID=A0ABQ5AB95_9ASTR